MGGFDLITSGVEPERRAQLTNQLESSMRVQSLTPAVQMCFASHTIRTFLKRAASGGGESWMDPADPGSFVAACATLIVRDPLTLCF